MQKLKNSAGSVLVGAVALSIILFIASLGFLQFLASTRNKEVESLRDDKAFLAAESGLQLGARWLRQQHAQPSWDSISLYALAFDEVTVHVDLIRVDTSTVDIKATAVSNKLKYTKQLSWALVQSTLQAGSYGVYLDNAYLLGGNTKGIRKMDWDGPAHFNTALELGNPGKGNETHFNDRVTLHNIDPTTNLPIFDPTHGTGHFGNDYRYGVEGGSGNWDAEFQRTYDPNSNRIVSNLITSGKTDLTLNASDSSLTFGVNSGTPYYQYKNIAGNLTTVNYDPGSELKLHIVNGGVSVGGSEMGKITVYTDAGRDIYIPGSLTYADFPGSSFASTDTSTNYNFGTTSTNILGLFSGGDFTVSEGTHYITALMFAVNASTSSVIFNTDKKNKTKFYLFGTLAVRGFWDSSQGNSQATFNQKWDRRQLSAPGLGFNLVDDNGNSVITWAFSSWAEKNKK